MKKFLLIIICFISFSSIVKADEVIINLKFDLESTFYSEITKSVNGNTTTFTYLNKIPSMDLTDAQLKTILSQKSGNGASPLSFYETLKITVTPDEHSEYAPLVGKDMYYRANPGGKWVSANTEVVDAGDIAAKKDLISYFWPYGFAVSYRKTTSESFTTSIPAGTDLSNKTMEQKLATLIGIDLTANPSGVIDAYKTLYYFRILPNSYTFKERFDIYSEKSTPPTLVSGKTDEYEISSLNHIDTGYVIIKYDKTEEANPTFLEIIDEKTNNWLPLLITFSILSIITVVIFLNRETITKYINKLKN